MSHLDQKELSASPGEQLDKLVQAISRSQHRYRELIDNLDQAVFTLSPDGEVHVANRLLSDILGVSFHELIGHRLGEFVAEPDPEGAKRWLPELIARGSWSGIVPVRLSNESRIRRFACWFQPVLEEGRIASVIGWARDITAHAESETRFTELFESLQEACFVTTPEGKILDANPAFVRMFGHSDKQEIQAINFRDLYDDPSDWDGIVRTLEERGVLQDCEVMYVRKDGARIRCTGRGSVVRDASGRVVRMQGTLVDVTERREIERRLQQEQEFVRRLIDSHPDVISVLDCEGRFIYASRRLKEVVGRDPADYVGMQVGAHIHSDDRARVAKHFQDFMAGKSTESTVEFRAEHADGMWRTLRVTIGLMRDDSGNITGVVASTRDITQSRLAESQLAQKEKLAAMGHMLTGAAHELNNPLTAILGVADLLRERAADDTTRRHAELVLQQARRAATIVQNLVSFSRPLAQGLSQIRVDEIVRQALQHQEAGLSRHNVRAEFELAPDLPPVSGDPKLLTQVFENIITNAVQAISSVKSDGLLKISVASAGGCVRVRVTDDGAGIEPSNLPKLFDPFFTTKRPGGGAGLGLTISMAVVKEHGGRIEVASTPGEGARFDVFLPSATDQNGGSAAAPGPAASAAPPAVGALRGHSVLVVDDEESIREIVQEGLSARGMTVWVAGSSEEAFSCLASNPCEIVLCDFNLPGLSGEQFFELLRTQRGASSPLFVFMTGELVDADVAARIREKRARVLQKPFAVSALTNLLIEILQPQPAGAK